MSHTKVYQLQIRALLGTASHFCEVVVLELRTAGTPIQYPRFSLHSSLSTPFTIHVSLLTIHCSLHTIHCSLRAIHCPPHTISPFTPRYALFTPHNSLLTPHYPRFTPHYLRFTPQYLRFTPYHSLFTPQVLLQNFCTLPVSLPQFTRVLEKVRECFGGALRACTGSRLQGYLAHEEQPTPLGAP